MKRFARVTRLCIVIFILVAALLALHDQLNLERYSGYYGEHVAGVQRIWQHGWTTLRLSPVYPDAATTAEEENQVEHHKHSPMGNGGIKKTEGLDESGDAEGESKISVMTPRPVKEGVSGDATTTDMPTTAKATAEAQRSNAKSIVMARRLSDDVSWVFTELTDWQPFIYTVNSSEASNSLGTLAADKTYHTPLNKGHESLAYLLFIVENYSSLPQTIAFVHSHKSGWPQAWHTDATDYSNVASISAINIEYVQKVGYENLRCKIDVGCPDEMQPFRNDENRPAEIAMRTAWLELFPAAGKLEVESLIPRIVAVPCCAQFVVSRAQILKRPRRDYRRYLDWLLDADLEDDVVGRVFEYLWHVIFGRELVHCPDVDQCYCNLYGQCDS